MNYENFQKSVESAVEEFKKFEQTETIRVISHLDADGISACAILIKLLNQENRKYSISIVQQLNKKKIQEFAKESYKYFIFTDLGSGQITNINKILKDKKILILDHHKPETKDSFENITHINPHLFDIDGSKEISGSGVVYSFAKTFDEKYEHLAHIAIVGAIGDIQEERGFLRLNHEILEKAIEKGNIEVNTGLRLFGTQTKPIHKVLEYSTDPYIPGVSGSESGTIAFLHHLGIDPKKDGEWKKFSHLTEEEMKKLSSGIIMKRIDEENPEDVFGPIYTLPNEKNDSHMKDAREFATLLNACGRLNKSSFGIGACLGIKKHKIRAIQTLDEYKKEIVNAINWYHDNKDSKKIIKKDKFMIINAEDNVLSTVIGTLASMISKSNDISPRTYIMSLAQTMDNTTKISLRISGNGKQKDGIDLREITKEIITKLNAGETGGHKFAAGALIPTEKEDDFIKIAKEVLEKRALEEKI